MKILVVNSNTSVSVTDAVAAQARASATPGTEIVALTAPFGPAAIQGRADAVVAAHATLDAITGYPDAVDAAVIACFSDPGLMAARQAVGFPVVGIAEASMLTACMLGARFAIVTVAPDTLPQIRELVAAYGLSSRLAGVRAIRRGVLESHADPQGTLRALGELVGSAVSDDGADVVILGGAVTAGMAGPLSRASSVPVLDCVACAVLQAQALAGIERLRRGDGRE